MEAGEENGSNVSLKRQRAPLSDSEDNVSSAADGQKRRRLEAAGQENRSPKPSTSRRQAELEVKPDTPMVPSIRSRVQQLSQRGDGATPVGQRCSSDPEASSSSVIAPDSGFREPLLGEEEFHQRMERFKVPVFQASPAPSPSPAHPSLRSRSDFVSNIQQKLQDPTTASTKQASRIRQEREQELSQLPFQPISENAWMKRSSSDSSLTQQGRSSAASSPSSSVPRPKRKVQWPPVQPEDQVHGDDDMMKVGSFTEAPTSSGAEKPSVNITAGEQSLGSSEAAAASVEPEISCGGQKENRHRDEEAEEEKEASAGNEDNEQPSSQQPETQTVQNLSFSEDQSFSRGADGEDQSFSRGADGEDQSEFPSAADEQSFSASPSPDESNTKDMREVSEEDRSEVFTLEEDETIDESSYGDEAIEPSTDEELKMWRYPKHEVCRDEEEEVFEASGVDEDGLSPAEIVGFSEIQEDEKPEPDEDECERCSEEPVENKSAVNMESCEGSSERKLTEDTEALTTTREQKDEEGETRNDDESKENESVNTEDDMEVESDDKGPDGVKLTEASPEDIPQPVAASSGPDGHDGAQRSTEIRASDQPETGQDSVHERQEVTGDDPKKKAGESSKRVSFILEPVQINGSENETSAETSVSDAEVSSHDETNTAEIIDQMFEEVLEYAGRIEDERRDDEDDLEDRDSGICAFSEDKDKMDTESEKEKSEEEEEEGGGERCDEDRKVENKGDELLTFPSSGILSPLSKSVEAVVTPLRLESSPPSFLLTPEETSTPPAESAPLYSIDAYRTQRQKKLPPIQSVTPGVQRRAAETSKPQPSVNTKEKISALNEEAGKLQTVINQTLQALSCCTDEEHGRGSVEEAEAEKLLLVSCEKRSALLAEVTRLREERSSESGQSTGEDKDYVSQQPCRGTVGITNIQLPLKVEFVCSSHSRAGRPSHYFFVLIRYGPCNIVATPLATAADAQNGDTISFSTSVTLKDIRSSFEIDVEVYSLSHTSGASCTVDRATTSTKSRVTPRKLLSSITRSSNSLTSAAPPALNTRRSSNFCLVGSHKITLASLGHSKFPLDKMKLEGKIRRLLGDEFQEKVPFLSPLEGNIYLQLDSHSHSNVQHQGFLTMFELNSGFGLWHRRYFVLEGCNMFYWNHPNDRETKEAEGSISLSSSPSQCIRPVKRDSCARPFTFELVSSVQQQEHIQDALAKCWFSADTKQERLDWMEKLNQALLDFHTWNRSQSESQQQQQHSITSSSGSLRESIL